MPCAATSARTLCSTVQQYDLVNVPVTEADLTIVKNAMRDVSFPTWAEICNKSNPGCSEAWQSTVGSALGIQ